MNVRACDVDEQVAMAFKALDNLEAKFSSMYRGNTETIVAMFYNKWIQLPLSIATKGVLTCLIKGTVKNGYTNIVYIPMGGEVKPHWHKTETEKITIISGNVSYKIYASKEYKDIVKGGMLHEGQSITIPPQTSHYVFTTEVESYIKIDFIDKLIN